MTAANNNNKQPAATNQASGQQQKEAEATTTETGTQQQQAATTTTTTTTTTTMSNKREFEDMSNEELAAEPEPEVGPASTSCGQQATEQQQQQATASLADNQLTNLIVNYLPQSMSQEEIRTLFSSIGEVESCKLIRDKSTINQSLGYGFVNYQRPEDAQRAIKSFNGLRLQNKTIKVSYARPSSESIKGANLYVSGLPKSMTQLELELLFKPYGKIITSRILCDNLTGISKGVGFVRFDQRFEAEKAIENLNNTYVQIQNDTVRVSRNQPPPSQPPAQAASEGQQEAEATGEDSKSQSAAQTTGDCSQVQTGNATPIIVKFANSPSSNPQKQIAAAAAAAASAVASGSPQSAHHLHSHAPHLSHAPHASGGGSGGQVAAGAYHLPAGRQPPQSMAAAAAAAAARFSAVVSSGAQSHVAAGGPIYHYPANTRFRYSPLAAQLAVSSAAAAAGSLLNPFAAHSSHYPRAAYLQTGGPFGGGDQSVAALAAAGLLEPAAIGGGGPQQQAAAQEQLTGSCISGKQTGGGYLQAAAAAAARARMISAVAAASGSGGLAAGQLPVAAAGQLQASPLDQHAHRLAAAAGATLGGFCLFVYNLAPEVEESVIWKLFGPFGAVQQVNLVKDAQTDKCKGFAFVTMSDYSQALAAIQSLNGCSLANRVLQVSFKTSKVRRTMQ